MYITHMKSKELITILEADGWMLCRVKGSHHVFTHPAKRGHITVPHPKKELGKGLVHKILKQAEIEPGAN